MNLDAILNKKKYKKNRGSLDQKKQSSLGRTNLSSPESVSQSSITFEIKAEGSPPSAKISLNPSEYGNQSSSSSDLRNRSSSSSEKRKGSSPKQIFGTSSGIRDGYLSETVNGPLNGIHRTKSASVSSTSEMKHSLSRLDVEEDGLFLQGPAWKIPKDKTSGKLNFGRSAGRQQLDQNEILDPSHFDDRKLHTQFNRELYQNGYQNQTQYQKSKELDRAYIYQNYQHQQSQQLQQLNHQEQFRQLRQQQQQQHEQLKQQQHEQLQHEQRFQEQRFQEQFQHDEHQKQQSISSQPRDLRSPNPNSLTKENEHEIPAAGLSANSHLPINNGNKPLEDELVRFSSHESTDDNYSNNQVFKEKNTDEGNFMNGIFLNDSMSSKKHRRIKARNSTWTPEDDNKLMDLVFATLPRQDYAEYAKILDKRDSQTVRYRWKVLVKRFKVESANRTEK